MQASAHDEFEVLGSFEADHAALEHEDTWFAASLAFVRAHGGPVTRRFLDVLPAGWQTADVIIDSELVWVPRGHGPGVPWFHFETYPYLNGGAFERVNREIAVEHIAVHIGPGHVEVLRGDVEPALRAPIPGSWPHVPSKECVERDRALRSLLDDGRVGVVQVGEQTLYRHGGGAFLRYLTAEASGFRLWLRATRGSRRPVVNGLRTLVQ